MKAYSAFNITAVFSQYFLREKRLKDVYKRIVFAEELGHHFTSYGDTIHLSSSAFNTISKTEYIARRRGADFLIPEVEFAKLVAKKDNSYDLGIHDIAEEYGVAKEFLEFRWYSYFNRNGYR